MKNLPIILIILLFALNHTVSASVKPDFKVFETGISQHTQHDLFNAKNQGLGISLNLASYYFLRANLAFGKHIAINNWNYYGIDRSENNMASITSLGLIPVIRYIIDTDIFRTKMFWEAGAGINLTAITKHANDENNPDTRPFFFSRSKGVLVGHLQPEIKLGYGFTFSVNNSFAFEIEPEYHFIWITNEAPYSNFHFWCLKLGINYTRN